VIGYVLPSKRDKLSSDAAARRMLFVGLLLQMVRSMRARLFVWELRMVLRQLCGYDYDY
jgi:hypothetical protein